MAKDPAFLFYSSDFLTGCFELSMAERGQYITLLCLQHQKGHLSKKVLGSFGNVSDSVLEKFQVDENGLYFNARLEEESIKRANYTQSRSENGKKGGRPPKNQPQAKPCEKHMVLVCKPQAKPCEKHTENENVTIDIDSNIDSSNLPSNSILNNNTTTTTTNLSKAIAEMNAKRQRGIPSMQEVHEYFTKHLMMSADEASLFYAYNANRGWDCAAHWQETADLWYERHVQGKERKTHEFT